jgi:two-component system chemotaxis response regulator CheB
MSSDLDPGRVPATSRENCSMAHQQPLAVAVRPGERRYRLVVIAASLGGVQAIGDVLSALPANFPVPIAVVLHRTTAPPNLLEEVLARRTRLMVRQAEDSEPMLPGTVYLAPPDRHLKIRADGFALTDGRKIRHVLSSANPLFESAAQALGSRVIAVVLTGGDRDATDGVQAVNVHGGFVIAQDEATSEVFSMPHSAIQTGCVDLVLPLEAIGPALIDLVDHARDNGHE